MSEGTASWGLPEDGNLEGLVRVTFDDANGKTYTLHLGPKDFQELFDSDLGWMLADGDDDPAEMALAWHYWVAPCRAPRGKARSHA